MSLASNRKPYIYARPAEGQIEEQWFAKLPEKEQTHLEAETRRGIQTRVLAWNASHPANRQFPRVHAD